MGRDDMPHRAPPLAAPRLWAAWRAPASAQWAFSPREQPPHGASVEEGKGVRWVQWFLDPIRIQARTAAGVSLEDERKDKKKVPLKIEQTAAEWVKSEGWDTMCDDLEGEGLLQHVVDMGGVQVSWTHAFRQWGKSLLATSDVVWKCGPLRWPDMKVLRTELKKWGRPIRRVK